MILHLGVVDLTYHENEGTTTAEVAQELENNYQVMQNFYDFHEDFVTNAIANDVQQGIDDIMNGIPTTLTDLNGACDKIKVMFNYFIDNMEMNGRVDGVPTKASLMGKNNRFKKGSQDGIRPSFKDTGLYESSFVAWVSE